MLGNIVLYTDCFTACVFLHCVDLVSAEARGEAQTFYENMGTLAVEKSKLKLTCTFSPCSNIVFCELEELHLFVSTVSACVSDCTLTNLGVHFIPRPLPTLL